MTDQERPVEERDELLGDLLKAANTEKVALAEPETPQRAEEAATTPAAPSAEAPNGAPSTEAATPDAAAAAPATDAATPDEPAAEAPEATEAAAATPDAPSAEATPEATEVTAATPDAPSAEATPEATEATAATPDAPSAEATPEAPAAEAPADALLGQPADAPGEASEATAEVPTMAAPAAAEQEVAEGASYVAPAAEDATRPRRVKDLTQGMELEGRVTSIALYGVFVDIGVGRDGLVHISEMSDTRVDSPSDVVKIGDRVKVRVKSVEPDGRRISLTMRTKERSAEPRSRGRRKPEIDTEKLQSLRVGDNVEGTITGLAPFGVFVDIGVGKDGLVHVSELAEGRIEKAEEVVQVGQTHTFKVLEVDAEGARISLSLRRAQRGQRMQQLQKGQIVEGTVSGLAPFGAFVDIGVGRDGLVHISELSYGRVGRVEDAVKVGDKVQVRVLDVDSQSKRISLTMRLEDTPREEQPGPQVREDRGMRGPRDDRPREDRGRREDRPRGPRPERVPETYTTASEPEEDFTGNATLEDLMSKFGGSRKDRRRRPEDEEEDPDDRNTRRQRDAIRRTLEQLEDE